MPTIREIAERFLYQVKLSGSTDVMAICPFHRKADGSEEKNGSFAMNICNGLWYCHSCHSSGNLYTFLRDVGVSRNDIDLIYKDTLEQARHHAPKKSSPLEIIAPVEMGPLDESFLGLFDFCPQLLIDEGFSEQTLRHFDVGYD